MWHDERLLIGGELVPAEANTTYATIDPSSGEPLGSAADASVADAHRAIVAAIVPYHVPVQITLAKLVPAPAAG